MWELFLGSPVLAFPVRDVFEAMQALSDRDDNDINIDSLPGDRVTEAMLMALDEFWAEGVDAETRQAAWSLLQCVRDADGMVCEDALALWVRRHRGCSL